MRVILVRHGETDENERGLLQGHSRGTLNQRGLAQIEQLATRLAHEDFELIISSDLGRAVYTAEQVNRHHLCPIEKDPRLRERCLGEFEGRPITDYLDHVERIKAERWSFQPPGGESISEVGLRAAAFLDWLVRTYAGHSLLLSSHGLFNRALINHLHGNGIETIFEFEQENTCVNIFEVQDTGAVEFKLINCTAHLSEETTRKRGKTVY